MRPGKIYPIAHSPTAFVRSTITAVPAGFPSPADDHLEDPVDLIEQLVPNRMASFLWRIEGRSMEGGSIFDGDFAIVDRSITPRNGHIVVAVIDGGCTIKQLRYRNGTPTLIAIPALGKPYKFLPNQPFEIWGVVRHTVTSHLKRGE